jgi:hypothetical protein
MKSIVQVLDQIGPTGVRRRRRCPRRCGRRVNRHRRPMPGGTLDLVRLHRTGGDPGVGQSHQVPEQIPNPRVRVTQRPQSPSPTPPAYWSMEPSDPATSLRGHRELPCAIHGMGSCRTRLRQGNWCCHHQVRGRVKRGPPMQKMWSRSPLQRKKTTMKRSKSYRCPTPHHHDQHTSRWLGFGPRG